MVQFPRVTLIFDSIDLEPTEGLKNALQVVKPGENVGGCWSYSLKSSIVLTITDK